MTRRSSLTEIASWIALNGAPRKTPLGGETSVGPWANIVTAELDGAPPIVADDPEALLLYVPAGQAAGLALPSPVLTPRTANLAR